LGIQQHSKEGAAMTQQLTNALMDRFIDLALRHEAKRDAQLFESPEYWRQHDLAIDWHAKAEQLMPRCARSIEPTDARQALTRICAWCQKRLGGPRVELSHPQTHGICPACSDEMLKGVGL
jgi:hypothetical protein